jgi:NACalpha-BTF3-like transcription factor
MTSGMAASLNLEIEQMGVKTTFLHGEVEEEIYMEHPEVFLVKCKDDYMCKVKKKSTAQNKHQDNGT